MSGETKGAGLGSCGDRWGQDTFESQGTRRTDGLERGIKGDSWAEAERMTTHQ